MTPELERIRHTDETALEVAKEQPVLCLCCGEWVAAKNTVLVVGHHEMRAHVCLIHLVENGYTEFP